MKTLYVSDLDGTLLNSQQQTSTYTNQTIEKLVDQGMLFSYATARSYYSAKPATKGLSAKIPLILYNGAFIIDNQSQEILVSNFFLKKEVNELAHYFNQKDFYPIVYAFINEQEKFSYISSKSTKQQLDFISTRNDKRKNPVENNLFQGDVFYVSCIASKKQLESFYYDLKDRYQCLFSKDIYSQDWWLEILPKNATKAHAILQLKDYLKCEKVVVFGDGLNDLSMFEIADESYAVENACEELKEKATGIIGRHDQDAVARWLEENYKD
ncbi:HAD family hydrolase [Clostridium ammoniilyticum]|jgi:Cof subfamily protein (haloacid dehalogenase superfamily)|uniref:HAD family hydrolase n=1 Tax=[Clostridium] ammoniilyticum TaxID=2981784 RepID=A0ABT2SRT5_9FIRM|nr:HAD family hydrolase [[Clostridium] ammoniilyticum]MCU6737331.1 HAD family hydrolase [[Clostridium] ammoniilyticum]SCH04689.1 putative hydrolase [uncultured Clostridium sp.]